MDWTIGELAQMSGVTRRTIRYYVEIGLLPPPSGAGKAAVYGQQHLDRLTQIKLLQSARLSLEEIRDELAGRPGEAAFAEMAQASVRSLERSVSEPQSAADYIASLRQPAGGFRMMARAALPRGETEYDAEPWVRISLSPDVELHVRRRGARSERWLWRLVNEAKRILEEEKEVK